MTDVAAGTDPGARRRGGRGPAAAVLIVVALAVLSPWLGRPVGAGIRAAMRLAVSGAGPANDDFSSAASIGAGLVAGTTEGAGTESVELSRGFASSGQRTVWFTWKSTSTAAAIITPADVEAPAGTAVRAYRGAALDQLTRVDTGPSADGTVTFAAEAGTTYALQVVGTGNGSAFRYTLFQPDAPFGPPLQAAPQVGSSTTTTEAPLPPPPVVTCDQPPTGWSRGPIDIACRTAPSDHLVHPGDAAFTLHAQTPDGTESAGASTASRTVCDTTGQCATGGPLLNLQLDRKAPTITCDPVSPVWSPADVTIHCSAADDGAGLKDPTQATITLRTSVPDGQQQSVTLPAIQVCDLVANCATAGPFGPILVDKSPPQVQCDDVPTTWSNAEAAVSCRATDTGAGLADASQSTFVLRTHVGAGGTDPHATTGVARVCDKVGNCTAAGPLVDLKVDRAGPSISCSPSTDWSAATVQVSCTATDSGAGLADTADASFTLSADAPAGTSTTDALTTTRSVCDKVGNCSTAGPIGGIRIDHQPPVVACDPAPTGWSHQPVTVHCTATDVGAGLVAPADAAFDLSADTPSGTASDHLATGTRKVCDAVANCTTSSPVTGIRIDKSPPVVSCDPVPSGVSHNEVRVHCTATDTGSGLRDGADADFSLSTSVGAGRSDPAAPTGTREVCDLAGNCSTAGPLRASVDRAGQPVGTEPVVHVPAIATVVLPGPIDVGPTPLVGPGIALFPLPGATDGSGAPLDVVCSPGPTATLGAGWTVVTCDATDGFGRAVAASFPVVVKAWAQIAAKGPAVAGGRWRVVGAGFAATKPVQIQLDATKLVNVSTAADGTLDAELMIPESTSVGPHTLSALGEDPSGAPIHEITPITVVVAGGPLRPVVSANAPDPLPAGAALPPDPSGRPAVAPPATVHTRIDPPLLAAPTPGRTVLPTRSGPLALLRVGVVASVFLVVAMLALIVVRRRHRRVSRP